MNGWISIPGGIAFVFFLGYLAIVCEHKISVNKAASALITAVVCWILVSAGPIPHDESLLHLNVHLADIAQIMIFLIGAMTIVELINVYDGFRFITSRITTRNKRALLWIIVLITFFLSSLLDNLTTSIVMILLLRRFFGEKKERLVYACMIVVAANAGGAWSPIGDVTTTMLWMDNRVTSFGLTSKLFFPSLVSVLIPLLMATRSLKKSEAIPPTTATRKPLIPGAKRVLILGVSALILVPVLRELTDLPPYMGIILGLGIMWMLTDQLHQGRHFLNVPHVLTKIDISSVLFFLGILLSVAALETIGLLNGMAAWMDGHLPGKEIILAGMGILSAVIDNVPLTAGVMGMYDLATYPVNSKVWLLCAYCLGTGGSILIIGSAAGIVVMGMEQIKFMEYLKKISFPALLGYLSGLGLLWMTL